MSPESAAAPPSSRAAASPSSAAVGQLLGCLDQLDALLERLDDEQYAAPLEGIFGGSIGGHVRHCLDHVRVLASAAGPDVVDYDSRDRGTDVEHDRGAARAELGVLGRALAARAATDLDAPLALDVLMSPDGLRVPLASTFGREVAFVFSHTIHHQAMIAGMARHLGVAVPRTFGRAPSTVAHDEGRACAR